MHIFNSKMYCNVYLIYFSFAGMILMRVELVQSDSQKIYYPDEKNTQNIRTLAEELNEQSPVLLTTTSATNSEKIAIEVSSTTAPVAKSDTMSLNSITNTTDELEDEILKMTKEDLKVQEEWGGNCTSKHWDKCKVIRTWFGYYIDETDQNQREKYMEVDCFAEPVICMKSGWTVNRCHLLCMGECNKDMQAKYDKYVSHEGLCKANAHG